MTKTIESIRSEWLNRLSDLAGLVAAWGRDLGWEPRQIETKITESRFGEYSAPALIMQKDTAKVLLEPIARFATGADGVVDLYLIPAYDDLASLYFYDGAWHLHYMFPNSPTVGDIRQAESQPFSKESLQAVLEEMKKNAA